MIQLDKKVHPEKGPKKGSRFLGPLMLLNCHPELGGQRRYGNAHVDAGAGP